MTHFLGHDLSSILAGYGYFAVLGFVLIETTGIPFPGETMLILASAFAGSTHRLSIYFVIAAAICGAVAGDNIGFWVGRTGGYKLLRRYGHVIHVNDDSLKIGLYLFKRHGGKIVFFARWIPLLRMWGALLAGTHRVPWKKFLVFNAAGAILWATFYGVIAYFFGHLLNRFQGVTTYAGFGLAAVIIIGFFVFERMNHHHWNERAQAAFPGPLD